MQCFTSDPKNRPIFDPKTKECIDKNTKFVIKGDCQSYRRCYVNKEVSPYGKWIEFACESDKHFDQERQECINSNESNCISETTTTTTSTTTTTTCTTTTTTSTTTTTTTPTSTTTSTLTTTTTTSTTTITTSTTTSTITTTTTTSTTSTTTSTNSTTATTTKKIEDYSLLKTLTSHTDLVQAVAFGSNNLLASGSEDKTIKLWNTNKKK
jgi:hypothetical protein